jgi:hypothetical protein
MNKSKLKFVLTLLIAINPLIAKAQNYCDFVQKVQTYQDSVKLKYTGNYDMLDSSTFNLKTYLSYFDKLNPREGMKIGVHYFDNIFDGNPYLYAIKSYQDLENIIGIPSLKQRRRENLKYKPREIDALFNFLNDSTRKAKNNIIPENSEYGIFQYLFFSEMGEQFALKWHANYGEKYIICSKSMIKQFINEHKNNEMFSVASASLRKFEHYSPELIIKTNDDFYEITWIENRTHSGVYKCTYHIDRKFPFKIVRINEEMLLEINMNFLY